MENHTNTITLGISPGTRVTGLAIAKNGSFIDWQLKAFKGKWSGMKLTIILRSIEGIIEKYGITHIVLKIPHPSRSSKAVNKLCKEIQWLAHENNVSIQTCTSIDLRKKQLSPKHNTVREKQKLNEAIACALISSAPCQT